MDIHKLLLSFCATLVLSACSSTDIQPQSDLPVIPDWVGAPTIKDGIAASACVLSDSGFTILKKKATALARADLAQTIETNVKAMDTTFSRRTNTSGATSSGSDFESVSKQIANQTLSGSQVTRTEYVELEDGKNLCVMVGLSPELASQIFDNIIKKSGQNVSPQDEAILYERFLAQKAMEKMDAEFQAEKSKY